MFRTEMCKQCGKMIIPGPYYQYKLEKDGKTCYYCCYNHYRKNGGDKNGIYRVRY